MKPHRIVLYGNFGAGNLGNECTLQTAIEETLRRAPHAQLLCVCTNPEDVRTRHGIAAVPSLWKKAGWSWSDLQKDPSAGQGLAVGDRTTPGRPASRSLAARLLRAARSAVLRAPRELAHWYRSLRVMAGSDVFLVPGTGIVTDKGCGSLGYPYDLFKLTILARLCRARVVYLSVGAGPFEHKLGCWFVRRSLGLAHYRSYRDGDSKRRLQAIGFNATHDAVYPDLVFGLSPQHLGAEVKEPGRPRVVGLGLKDYAAPLDETDANGYRAYLELMADFVVWLQSRGHTVRLIIGDAQYDTRVREDLLAVLKARGEGDEPLSDPVPTVEELLRQLRETDAVVSPRFHNLVLALILNKPVIALSDLPKVDALLSDLGLQAYCLSLQGLRAEDLTGRFAQLESEAATLRALITEQVQGYRRLVDEQYSMVLGNGANPGS